MKVVWNIVGKIILIILLVTIVVPVGYLAWRAGQPMELPQFNGLTYYEYLNWRKNTLHQMAVDYQAAHPNAKMGGGLDLCFQHRDWDDIFRLADDGFYTLAGAFPGLEKYVPPRDRQYIPQERNTLDFPAFLVENLREVSFGMLTETSIHTSVVYCRLAGTPPCFHIGQSLTESETRIK